MFRTLVPSAKWLFELLRGHWSIERQIEPGGRFAGTAAFAEHAVSRLLYRETGYLTLDGGNILAAENAYVYALQSTRIEVSFASGLSKGRHFIDIALDSQSSGWPIIATDRHLCRKDVYDAIFRMETEDRFIMTYVVHGPAKSYVSRSVYERGQGDRTGRRRD